MSNLILPSEWTSQPQVPVTLDKSHPFYSRCLGLYHPANNNNRIANPSRSISIVGVGDTFLRTSSQHVTIPLVRPISLTGKGATLIGIVNSTNLAASQCAFALTDGSSHFSVLFRGDLAGDPISAASWNAGASSFRQFTGAQYLSGVNYVVAITTDASGNFNVYINGVLSGGYYPNTGTIPSVNLTKLEIAASNGTGDYLTGSVFFATAFEGALSASEIKSLSDNPWQIFKSQSRRIFVASAGGGTTLAITGQEVTAGLGTVLPDINYSIGGQSVTTSVGALVANLNVAITGQVLPVSLGSQVASISTGLAGQAVPLSLGTITVFSSGAVSLAITGQSTMISLGSFIPNTSYSLSGQNISASINNLTSDIMYTLSGQSTPIVLGTVAASVNSTLVGQPVSLTLGSTSASISTVLNGQSVILAQSFLSPIITSSITGQGVLTGLGTITAVGGTNPQYSKNSNLYYNIGNDLSIMLGSPTITTWNNSGRPTGVKVGTFGFNTETNKLEVYTGSGWIGVLLT